jgi:hypothetical protein
MSGSRTLPLLAILGGVVLILIGIVYFIEPAHSLPSFFPGHVGSGSSESAHHHVKHGIAAIVVGLAAFAYAWFSTGPAGRGGTGVDAPGAGSSTRAV